MIKKVAICPRCNTKLICKGEAGQKLEIECTNCGKKGLVLFVKEALLEKKQLEELDFYPVNEPYAYIKILRDKNSLDKYYKVIEPRLVEREQRILNFIQETLMESLKVRSDELESSRMESFLTEQINIILKNYEITVDDVLKKKILYYVKRDFLRFGKIDPLMRDPNIEDISCDGAGIPMFLYHRRYGSVKSNVQVKDEESLSSFVIKLAQKCGKHISIAEPMLDATMPDGSRIQMTLSKEVTTKGSTFTIRKFRDDPITPTDLIEYKTLSAEMVAYMWMAVENGINALIAGGTAAGKTSTLNALSLFIPRESKIVSIEETREINLPHPNWIPGVARSGFGEIVNDKFVGEIDLFDLMKAALRQRPEYILLGEIRGNEAYVLFQAMATGHTTYSTFHADSTKALIHRLEGKPIDIPRVMLRALDIIVIQVNAQLGDDRVRRCKQIVEIIDIDPNTKEILTNEVFHWDPVEDRFMYSGKSYVLERIRHQYGLGKEEIMQEIKRRVEILNWMYKNDIRLFTDFAKVVTSYAEIPDKLMEKIRQDANKLEKNEDLIKKNQEFKKPDDVKPSEIDKNEEPIKDKQAVESHSNIKIKKRIGFRRGKNNSN